MPGPSNTKGKRKSQGKTSKKDQQSRVSTASQVKCDDSPSPLSRSPTRLLTPPPPHNPRGKGPEIYGQPGIDEHETMFRHGPISPKKAKAKARAKSSPLAPRAPFIHDPGNGPRVRDARAFLSSFFAQSPALDDPLCAEFAQEEVLEMLMTLLPEEVALILWYNKSRSTSRVCPACQRLYRLGDALADHLPGQKPFEGMESSPQLRKEQILSGLCSPMCFILASYSYPGAIKSAWGRTADELDDLTWTLLNGPAEGTVGDTGLTMLMRMTRLHDLGLAQLCLGLHSEDLDE